MAARAQSEMNPQKSAMEAPVISFQNVSKRFGATPVLRRVAFEVPAGATFGLVGENGAGKTTLIKCLLDFCHFDGEIRVRGVSCALPESRACLAFLPERFNAPWFLTGREFIRTMQILSRGRWNESQAQSLYAELDLAPAALDRPVRHYSKGMNQKLGLAACFLSGRDLMVLDEPMSGLDPLARFRVKNILLRLQSEGRTVFFTSHSLADVGEICDHMAVLHGGALAYRGPPSGLQERYGGESLEGAFLKCIEKGGHD
jgi:ABC-2 type transport system ATP-binding protein